MTGQPLALPTTQPLRDVRVLERDGDRRLRRSARVSYAFRSADWTPWAAIRHLRRAWPDLIFDIRPDYGDCSDMPLFGQARSRSCGSS